MSYRADLGAANDHSHEANAYRNGYRYHDMDAFIKRLADNPAEARILRQLTYKWKELRHVMQDISRSDKTNVALAQFGCRVLNSLYLGQLNEINWVRGEERRLNALYLKLDQKIQRTEEEDAFLEAMRGKKHTRWVMSLVRLVSTASEFKPFWVE